MITLYIYPAILTFYVFLVHYKPIEGIDIKSALHNSFTQKIGNFSIELLYLSAKSEGSTNLVISPMTVWSLMTMIAEGATGDTLAQINYALRTTNNRTATRLGFQFISKWLEVHTNTVELARSNAIFVDSRKLPNKDFQTIAKSYYNTELISLDFRENGDRLADIVNKAVSQFTHGRIQNVVDSNSFWGAEMLLTTALYFKGQWTVPFNASLTTLRPFFDDKGRQIGLVNMMFNRYQYPFANIKNLQARVIEIPYGKENRLSMVVLLPYPKISVEEMFYNFQKVPIDTIFAELARAIEEYAEDEVELYLPRFRIISDLILTDILKKFGIVDLFDKTKARLHNMARTPLYVSKVIHKAEIEVTEEGTIGSGIALADAQDRITPTIVECNRPFSYFIIEKTTNSIVFGGIYRYPYTF